MTPTERVTARLMSEGWVRCPDLSFEALCQTPLPDLRTFVLEQLQMAGSWMSETDLQLATLVFSIPTHEFEFHPNLTAVLNQMESEGIIEVQQSAESAKPWRNPERRILFKAFRTS